MNIQKHLNKKAAQLAFSNESCEHLFIEGEFRFGPVFGIEVVIEDSNEIGVAGEWCWKVVDEGVVMDSANGYSLSLDALQDACESANKRLEAKGIVKGKE